jgi:hypothetical protein
MTHGPVDDPYPFLGKWVKGQGHNQWVLGAQTSQADLVLAVE